MYKNLYVKRNEEVKKNNKTGISTYMIVCLHQISGLKSDAILRELKKKFC